VGEKIPRRRLKGGFFWGKKNRWKKISAQGEGKCEGGRGFQSGSDPKNRPPNCHCKSPSGGRREVEKHARGGSREKIFNKKRGDGARGGSLAEKGMAEGNGRPKETAPSGKPLAWGGKQHSQRLRGVSYESSELKEKGIFQKTLPVQNRKTEAARQGPRGKGLRRCVVQRQTFPPGKKGGFILEKSRKKARGKKNLLENPTPPQRKLRGV